MKRDDGFSLVELLVALVIGLIVILGAGQLLMSVFETNRQVSRLSEKQAAVNFAVETLLRDIRRADWGGSQWDDNDGILTLTVVNRGDVATNCDPGDEVIKEYKLQDRTVAGEIEWFMAVNLVECNGVTRNAGFQALVGGFLSPAKTPPGPGFDVDDIEWNKGIIQVTFRLIRTDDDATPDTLTFYAVNRTEAVKQ